MNPSISSARQGIAFILAGALCLSVSDALAKWLSAFYGPAQLIFLRSLIAAPVLALLVVACHGAPALRALRPGIHAVRGLLNVGAACAFYAGLSQVPLAAATAVAYAAPLFVTLISVLWLHERLRAAHWLCVLGGFAGVLAVVRPDAAGFHWAYLYPLASAVGYAVLMVSARHIPQRERMLTTMFYIALGQLVFAGAAMPWQWTSVNAAHLPHLAALALFSALGLGLITQAFRAAPASLVAPLDYTGLVWAGLIGWVGWNEALDGGFFVGAALIVASGIGVVLLRERTPRPAAGVAAAHLP